MRKWVAIFSSFFLLGAKPTVSPDSTSHKWATVRDWEVWVDKTRSSCFMMRGFERNAVFRVGFGTDTSSGYIFLANEAWKSLVVGSKYAIEVQLDEQPPWAGNATAKKLNDVTYLYMDFAGQKLIDDLAHSDNAVIRYKGAPIAMIRLAGSDTAVEELMRCQSAANQPTASSSKPTNALAPNKSSVGNDPFAR